MKLVTIGKKHLKHYTKDKEMMQKAGRPCVIIAKLKYKGRKRDFAIPIRSNISPSAPKNEYHALPTRYTTKDTYRHGIHYIKMFPVKRGMYDIYHTEGNMFASIIKSYIEKDKKSIIQEAQDYLIRYENGDKPQFSTDLDMLIDICEKI